MQEKERYLFTLADGVLVPGSILADYLKNESLYTGTIYHCPPGIEFTELDTAPSDLWNKDPFPRLITVGTLSPSKGQLDILSHLQQLTPPFKGTWRLLGDLHTEPEVYCHFQRKLNNSNLKESVHLYHSVPHSRLGKLLTDADLLVSASRFESYGMAIAEAVAAGIPVLAYRVGETSQWIKEGENGFLIPVGDQKNFKSTLTKLLHHPKELYLLKKQAQKIKEKTFLPTWEMAFQYFLEALGE
ncbi:glycosyltransferase family 4 protein [Nitrosococcus wardiae]|uniref:glycosyltransferase family 4 protein n=1 Tax=Nitrosococcus wardiae TaxID=1814290 RepID=UPI001F0D1358|nr:glycosyltransferase [Nitrosococcus wardiae]